MDERKQIVQYATVTLLLAIAHASDSIEESMTLIDGIAEEMKRNIRENNLPHILQ